MPLGLLEREVLRFLAAGRSPESYVGGATVLHQGSESPRSSKDVDIFHETDLAVEKCSEADINRLREGGYRVEIHKPQLGFVRAFVWRGDQSTKIEWVRDSVFRFFPVEPDFETGWRLSFWDAATNKLLAFAGRMKLRDYFDVMFLHEQHLHVGALAWAAVGKDPGLSPELIIDWGGRQARLFDDPTEAARIGTTLPLDLKLLRRKWLAASDEAFQLISKLPPTELGCLYLNTNGKPVCPDPASAEFPKLIRHFGSVKGAWPRIAES